MSALSAPPWREDPRTEYDIVDATGKVIATMLVDGDVEAMRANRRAMTLSPVLLGCLRHAQFRNHPHAPDLCDGCALIDEVLGQAEGL